jgi:uncharacterized protein involved in outer membrane biogenesis
LRLECRNNPVSTIGDEAGKDPGNLPGPLSSPAKRLGSQYELGYPIRATKLFMKKIFFRLLLVLLVLLVAGAVAAHFFLDAAVKRGVETFGPKLTQVEVKLDAVKLSLLSGSGALSGLVVGNPEGFKSANAISVGSTSLALQPASLLSDKIVIKSIKVQAPEITFEQGLHGNNLNKIKANLAAATGGATKEETAKSGQAGKKLQVDDLVISGGKVRVSVTGLGGATVSLPDIHLSGLGTGPDGITPAELTKEVLNTVLDAAIKQAGTVVADLSKGAKYLTNDAENAATNAAGKVTKSITDLFKKKP